MWGVIAQSLLAGYLELKAPGNGGGTRLKLKAADGKAAVGEIPQLAGPVLHCADDNRWALYRGCKRVGRLVQLSGDVTHRREEAISKTDTVAVFTLLRDFLLQTAPAKPCEEHRRAQKAPRFAGCSHPTQPRARRDPMAAAATSR